MRDLKKEIENVKKILRGLRPFYCSGISCLECPAHYAIKTMNYGVDHNLLFGCGDKDKDKVFILAAKRWLRGWLAMATGKWFSE